MAVLTFYVLSHHQMNIIFLLFARDIEDSNEYFIIRSIILMLASNG